MALIVDRGWRYEIHVACRLVWTLCCSHGTDMSKSNVRCTNKHCYHESFQPSTLVYHLLDYY